MNEVYSRTFTVRLFNSIYKAIERKAQLFMRSPTSLMRLYLKLILKYIYAVWQDGPMVNSVCCTPWGPELGSWYPSNKPGMVFACLQPYLAP